MLRAYPILILLLAQLASAQTIGVGVKDYTKPLLVKRQVPDKAYRVPAAWLATPTAVTVTADTLKGNSAANTILRFAPTITGPLIASESFGDAKLSAWWNNGATLTCFCPRVHDLAIDGRGQLHPHPYVRNATPDLFGPDAVPRGDGICLAGTGVLAERLRLFQIQGTALVVRGASIAGQSGQFGLYDEATTRLDEISVLQCLGGIDINAGDARVSRVSVSQVAKDGLTVSGPGTYIDDYHGWGCDRALVCQCQVHCSQLYCEAARIGCEIMPGCDGSTFDGLNIGPSTCTSRGVALNSHGVEITRLAGSVSGAQVVGVDIGDGLSEAVLAGRINAYNGATAVVVRGHHHVLDVRCDLAGGATAVKLVGKITGTKIDLTGWGPADCTALDLSEAQLEGCDVSVRFNGPARRVIYPADSNKLPTGNQLTIDGVAP